MRTRLLLYGPLLLLAGLATASATAALVKLSCSLRAMGARS